MKGFIYAISVSKSRTKIGFSFKPESRVKAVCTKAGVSQAEVYISEESSAAREWEGRIKAMLADAVDEKAEYPTETFKIGFKLALDVIKSAKPSQQSEESATENQTNLIALSEFLMSSAGNRRMVSSLKVAELSSRSHRDVLRSIKSMIDDGFFKTCGFYKSKYTTKQNKQVICYEMERDALFVLLSNMTGYFASEWKMWFVTRYLSNKNKLEARD